MFSPRVGFRDALAVFFAVWRKELSGRSPIVHRFERAFAEYLGVKYASAVNSGSSALFLAIKAMGLPKGDIICPAFGYIAIPNAIVQAGHRPVFVDVERDTGNIDASLIRITDKTRAIVAIDTYGHPCDYDSLKMFGVPVIQDAAEALGAEYKGKKVSGDVACYSFFANKTITTGEGGMVVSDSKALMDKVSSLKDQCGTSRRYYHDDLGYSLCMSALSAALGLSQLKKLDSILEVKRQNALNQPQNWIVEKSYAKHSHWAHGFIVDDQAEALKDPENRPFFLPYTHQPAHKSPQRFRNAEWLSEHGVYRLM